MELGLEIQKTNANKNLHPRDTVCANFQAKRLKHFLHFRSKFAQKVILRSEFQRYKSGFENCTSKVWYLPILSQNGQL